MRHSLPKFRYVRSNPIPASPKGVGRFGKREQHAAMTYEEIGRREGISKQLAYFFVQQALKKLRQNPHALRNLLELARMRRQLMPVGYQERFKEVDFDL